MGSLTYERPTLIRSLTTARTLVAQSMAGLKLGSNLPFIEYMNIKLNLGVLLAGNTVAMVTFLHHEIDSNVFTNDWIVFVP